MQIVGMLDSPFVRRVAISARLLGLEYDHNPLSIFRNYDEFRALNPLVKVPTLVCDNDEILVDSTLIVDYLEALSGKSLMPQDLAARQRALRCIGIALVAMEKVVQLIYETKQRPKELQHAPWVNRLQQQLTGALKLLEQSVGNGDQWMFGDSLNQADLTVAVAWRFARHAEPGVAEEHRYPGLVRFSERAERLPEFLACPID